MSESSSENRKRVRSASHTLLFEVDETPRCAVCESSLANTEEPATRGLLVFARGEEVRYEEPPLCDACGAAIGVTQRRLWDLEDDEEG